MVLSYKCSMYTKSLKIKKTIPFILSSKPIKYLKINLPRGIGKSYNENYNISKMVFKFIAGAKEIWS